MPIIDKKQMTEEDIKLNYITPALHSKDWKDKITMETQVKFTDGKINIHGNITLREKPKKADYILYINANNPIAIVEAKDNDHSVSYGMQQAIEYAKILDLPFAYSSNGDAFMEHDMLMGTEREIPIDDFPTPDELYLRFKRESNGCKGFSDEAISSYEVYFSLYQQLAGKSDNEEEESDEDAVEKFRKLFKPDFFDLNGDAYG